MTSSDVAVISPRKLSPERQPWVSYLPSVVNITPSPPHPPGIRGSNFLLEVYLNLGLIQLFPVTGCCDLTLVNSCSGRAGVKIDFQEPRWQQDRHMTYSQGLQSLSLWTADNVSCAGRHGGISLTWKAALEGGGSHQRKSFQVVF